MAQRYGYLLRRIIISPQNKVSGFTEVNGRYNWVLTKFLFIVRVPVEIVLTIPIPVQKNAVKFLIRNRLDFFFKIQKPSIPTIRFRSNARIGINLARIAVP